jgi:16S rRNA (adenine1518-N6/adenine1519-N6)-dimethyltransferase
VTRPKRSLGQNFLVDPNIQRKIVDAVDPGPDDVVVEIGPGTGALTRSLAERAGRLVAIELDDRLAAALAQEFADSASVTVLHRSVLDVDLATIAEPARIRVVGNIPYNITSPILFHLLARDARPADIVLMVQREVADRVLAAPGTGAYGALSIGVQSVARVERLFHVGRGAFRPAPTVDSTVIRIAPVRPPALTAAEERDLRALTRAAFAWRRKQLQKTLRAAPAYRLDADDVADLAAETGFDLALRPEALAPLQLADLARALRRRGRPDADRPDGAEDAA